ncbi:Mg-dependent DNase [Annulohypoxylon maeteangense]|uniref:Mg-dependent DNase n=1 Tax=Annulohypoxylon maeteangense TaxID=1927788 RepID=UPI00200808BF|nr:Mg-dependent DNase [Annulohypoxylon maeteangense]KAI0887751.1 Mg-dependent DNase [Annulohypoxylon maeteangense]
MASERLDLSGLPQEAPTKLKNRLRYVDVAVTATAKEFDGIYRNKKYHQADFINTLDRAQAAGVEKIMLTGMSLSDVSINIGIAQSRPTQCFVTIGVHPYHAAEPDTEGPTYLVKLTEAIRAALASTPCPLAAFGELGLDYDRLNYASKEVQIRTFKSQLDLFVENGWELPLFLHCRAAFNDFVEVISPYVGRLPRRGLVHSFVGSRTQMEKLVELGFDISVNGFSFQSQESVDMVAAIPLERLQVETDAPWGEIKSGNEVSKRYLTSASPLPPNKKRDKWDATCMVKERNESCTIERVAYVVAGLKGVTVDEVAEAAWKNSINMFGLGIIGKDS